jgi:hypothetical protein
MAKRFNWAIVGTLVLGGCGEPAESARPLDVPSDAAQDITDAGQDGQPWLDDGSEGSTDAPVSTGSFNLRFTTVEIHTEDAGGAQPGVPYAKDMEARLDIRQQGDQYEAAFTPRWATASPLQVHPLPQRLVLTGPVELGIIPCEWTRESLDEISIERDPSGGFTGAFTATGLGPGRSSSSSYPTGRALPMSASGSVVPDSTSPSVRFSWDPTSDDAQALEATGLPWSTVSAQFDEGIQKLSLADRLTFRARQGATTTEVHPTWLSPESSAGLEWTGVSRVSAIMADWDALSGGTLSAYAAVGIVDPANNPSVTSFTSKGVLFVGTPIVAHEFGSGPPSGGLWGPSAQLTGADAALCEAASCLLLGPVAYSGQQPARAGVAGRLLMQGKTRVSVRLRMFEQAEPCPMLAPIARIDIAVPQQGVVVSMLADKSEFIQVVQPESFPFYFATDWTEVIVALPAGVSASEVGFSITADVSGRGSFNSSCGSDPTCAVTSWPAALLVQSVRSLE